MSGQHHNHDHDHDHDHGGFMGNLGAGHHSPLGRVALVLRNLARRGRGGRVHACCGNYGEPGC